MRCGEWVGAIDSRPRCSWCFDIGAEDAGESGCDEGMDVGAGGEASVLLCSGAPAAEMLEDGIDEFRFADQVVREELLWFCGGLLAVLAIFELLKRFGESEKEADGLEIDFGRALGRFLVPDLRSADVAGTGRDLSRELAFGDQGDLSNRVLETEDVRGVGEVLVGSVLADLGIGDGAAGGDPAADFFDDL